MTKAEYKETVQKIMEAPSCCPEAKAACQAYLDAAGTDQESAAARALVQELKEDVCSIDDCIAFLESDMGKEIYGDGQAAAVKGAKESKAAGGKYCTCPACSNGAIILDNAADFLA